MKDYKNNLHQHAQPQVHEIARILRKNETNAEQILWLHLRNRQTDGLKFRRQHAFENFVLDFYCHEARLAIEADGTVHDSTEVRLYDNARTIRLQALGIKLLRFSNAEIENNIEMVLSTIRQWSDNGLNTHDDKNK